MFGTIIQNILRFALGINTEGHRGKMHFPAAALPVKTQNRSDPQVWLGCYITKYHFL